MENGNTVSMLMRVSRSEKARLREYVRPLMRLQSIFDIHHVVKLTDIYSFATNTSIGMHRPMLLMLLGRLQIE